MRKIIPFPPRKFSHKEIAVLGRAFAPFLPAGSLETSFTPPGTFVATFHVNRYSPLFSPRRSPRGKWIWRNAQGRRCEALL
jgi:hypothetical protein